MPRFAPLAAVLLLGAAQAAPLAAQSAGASTPETVMALLTPLAHDSLEGRLAGSPGAAKAATMIARTMQNIGLEAAGDSGYFQRIETDGGVNVVGILRGTDKSLGNEHIVVGAHYDHIGIGQPVDGDSINNGADDDASGVVAVLEVARQLAQKNPRRSVVFVAFANEEGGGTGSAWYLDHPVLPFDSLVAQLQVEMIGRPDSMAGGAGKGWLTGYERSTLGESLAAAKIPLVADPYPDQQFFFRSDNIAFARRGIVAHTLSSYNMHGDYHQVTDDVSRVDAPHMAAVINAAAQAVRLMADGEKPAWKPDGKPE